jgi:cell wall assembly regulator SMI1
MIENKFSGSSSAITAADLDHLESTIGKTLPPPFRNHYLKYNGGTPERTYWQDEDFEEPVEVSVFKPISDGESTVLSTYQLMLEKKLFLHTSYLSRMIGAATFFA